MAIVHAFQATPTMMPYGEYLPSGYVDGAKYPVLIFCHGIGELTTKKSIQSVVDFHSWFKTVADRKGIITLLPQDDGVSLFDDKEILKLKPLVDKYSNGQVFLGGLSRGGGTTLSIDMSNSIVKSWVCAYLPLCPPSWEGMNEAIIAADDIPTWWFHGAKDIADPGTYISRAVNTVDDIRRAGRKANFYFSVFPNDDHYIWTEVMGAIGYPPINPNNGAKTWAGKNTIVEGGVTKTIDIVVECVNNPAVDVYDWMKLQHKGNYQPLPLLGGATAPSIPPTPTPSPTPITTEKKFFKSFYHSENAWKIDWDNKTNELFLMPIGHALKQEYLNYDATGKQYLVVETDKLLKKVFDSRLKT